ncbi:hypothetical protein OAU96_02425 [Planctomycetota bacterium]|nr:hypothetical protein [Planctomycetota bacterium]
MTASYLDSKRITGAAADIAITQGGWKEVGRTTLGSSGDLIAVSGLADKRYYMVLTDKIGDGSANSGCWARLNSDTGSNYATRMSHNGGADSTGVSQANGGAAVSATPTPAFGVRYVANIATKEKLAISSFVAQNTAGAGTAPLRRENIFKWANTSDAVSVITEYNADGGDFATGSEVVVLGWDDSDTHTTNFWEELASVELGSASDTLDAGTISAKKYLWVQTYIKAVSGTAEPDMRFNNDSGSNYADRYSINGGSDGTGTSITSARGSGVPVSAFFNDFIINNASNEKLVIRYVTYVSTAGAGTAPNRRETVAKWSNTSDSITSIKWVENSGGAGQFDTGSIIKVWGSN